MTTALVHEWLTTFAGSEKVVEQLLRVCPGPLHVMVDFLEKRPACLDGVPVHTSFIQRLPFARKHYRQYLPLMPIAVEQFDLSGYDQIVSSQHCVAHGVLVKPDQLHVSYVHSPVRYAWDMQHEYLRESGNDRGLKSLVARRMLHNIRLWDRAAADRVDYFAANSAYIADRIRRCYRRKSRVIHPPVDVARFALREDKSDFYLAASRMVPYKRMGLIARAFTAMPHRRLVMIGDGPEYDRTTRGAGPNVTFLRAADDATLLDHMQRARAFVFAAEEDFGILPVEAQACGTPVIAYGRGGTAETVRDAGPEASVLPGPAAGTGVLFPRQTEADVVAAVEEFERRERSFVPAAVRENALRFGADRFRNEFARFLADSRDRFDRRRLPRRRRAVVSS